MIAFETFLALLIYGLVFFPNIDHFIDVNAIWIFLIGNPVPTLLGDAYHSIHHRTEKTDGCINCCTPLLYKWFISHLPQTRRFLDNPDGVRWSQKIMPLTNSNIIGYNSAYDIGGITYNPVLARRQFGYPMKDRPASIHVFKIFYHNRDGDLEMRKRFVRAWHHIDRKRHLGRKECVALKGYTDWVQARARVLKMPYLLEESSLPVVPPSSSVVLVEDKEEYQDGWLMEKDYQIRRQEAQLQQHGEKQKRQQEDLFSSSGQEDSVALKEAVNKLMVEKTHMKAFYEDELEKLHRKLHKGDGSSSDLFPFGP
ncbi:uncharacterized protein LOC131641894 [Vicia villosa]|uniref:uncharacterized protein LOC131641894 n=1 Tax=Vicia villosa TaxID=3911 RepID=UPI00273C16BD|nr:uncharacterized protein LOC131641894 [Vicia villosa]